MSTEQAPAGVPQPQTREQILATLPAAVVEQVASFTASNPAPELYFRRISDAIGNVGSLHDLDSIKALVLQLYAPNIPLATARSVFANLLTAVQTLSTQAFTTLASFILHVHHLPNNTRTFAFEAALISLRDRLSHTYEDNGDWEAAAEVLTRIPFETLSNLADNGVLRYNLRMASLFITANNIEQAEFYLNRTTSHLVSSTDERLALQYRVCHARILELKGRFDDAATRYYALANDAKSSALLDPHAMLDAQPALMRAVTCAILAPAGPRRARMLAVLFHDERSRRLDIFPLLESIHMGRLLRREQIERFRSTLLPQHLLQNSESDNAAEADKVLDNAALEHNLLAVSRMYSNIGLAQLADVLDVSLQVAEQTAAKMIYEKRMTASIDQVESIVQFSNTSSASNIERWDGHIANLCSAVDDCVDAIIAKYPQFASHLDA